VTGARPDTPPLLAMTPKALEGQAVLQGVLDTFSPGLEGEDDTAIFLAALRDVFPQVRLGL